MGIHVHHHLGIYIELGISRYRLEPNDRYIVIATNTTGALVVTRLLLHCGEILGVPLKSTYIWTDSTVFLSWL